MRLLVCWLLFYAYSLPLAEPTPKTEPSFASLPFLKKMWRVARRFEVQLVVTFVVYIFVSRLRLSHHLEGAFTVAYVAAQNMIRTYQTVGYQMVAIIFSIEYLAIKTALRLYINNNYRFGVKMGAIFFSTWGMSVITYGLYYIWCKDTNQLVVSSVLIIYGPAGIGSACLILGTILCDSFFLVHWIRNDYTLYESVKQSPTTQSKEVSDTSLRVVRVQDSRTTDQSNNVMSKECSLPRTCNDYKIIGNRVIAIYIVLSVIMIVDMVLIVTTMPGPCWLVHTFSFSLVSAWHCFFAATTYINRFYKVRSPV